MNKLLVFIIIYIYIKYDIYINFYINTLMFSYSPINDESILLHENCKTLLKRKSRKDIIDEVINKLNLNDNDVIKKSNSFNNDIIENKPDKFSCLVFLLNILGCNKN